MSAKSPKRADISVVHSDDQQSSQRRQAVSAESHDPERVLHEKAIIPSYPKTPEQHKFLYRECEKCFIFRQLEKPDLLCVVDAMKEIKVKADQIIIYQGDEGDNCYIIQKGHFEAWVSKKVVHKNNTINPDSIKVKDYSNGGLFGELALMYATPRAATVIARTEGLIWALDRVAFQKMVLMKVFKRRQQHIKFLKSVPLLQELSPSELLNVAEAITNRTYANGECIIKQGSPGEEMFFVEEGEVSIKCSKSTSDEKELTRVKKGGYFGELALVTKKPRAASAIAIGTVRVAVLDVDSFQRLLGPCKQVLHRNMKEYDSHVKF
jgi:cAMP-dependent protein kinase regulator